MKRIESHLLHSLRELRIELLGKDGTRAFEFSALFVAVIAPLCFPARDLWLVVWKSCEVHLENRQRFGVHVPEHSDVKLTSFDELFDEHRLLILRLQLVDA